MFVDLNELAKEIFRKSVYTGEYRTFNIPYLFMSKGDNWQNGKIRH